MKYGYMIYHEPTFDSPEQAYLAARDARTWYAPGAEIVVVDENGEEVEIGDASR